MEEIRRIRGRMSERLLEAERREGTCVPELRRIGREASVWMSRELGRKTAASSKRHRKAE